MKHILAIALMSVCAHSYAIERLKLTDEPSRRELARYAVFEEDGTRAVPKKFEFPKDAVAGKTFGIDVSHHQGAIKWKAVAGQRVGFVYVKATQGERFFDGRFAENWKALHALGSGTQPIRRGAYHFMTAAHSPEKQAENFIAAVGKLSADDLPPCLDMEWDLVRKGKEFVKDANGKNIDNWSTHSPKEIARRAKVWLELVEKGTGKRPIIYTNALWWKNSVGEDDQLASYRLWIADYSTQSQNSEEPRVPKGFKWALWQFTDTGRIAAANLIKGLDTNKVSQDVKDLSILLSPSGTK